RVPGRPLPGGRDRRRAPRRDLGDARRALPAEGYGSLTMWARGRDLDHRLMSRSFHSRSPALDRSLVGITRAANYSRLWLLVAGALAACGGRRGRRGRRPRAGGRGARGPAARGRSAIAIAALVANGPSKLLVRRRRPFRRSRPALIRMPRSTSFPSGHSAPAFAFATGACAELPALTPLLVPLAGAVAYSRVHAGVHYPRDSAAGRWVYAARGH